MKRLRRSPGVDLAAARLAAVIEEQRRQGNHFLPGTAELARRIGLSRVTVYKAVRRLAAQGALTPQPRKGIHINHGQDHAGPTGQTPMVAAPVADTPAPRWQQVMSSLNANLAAGLFPPLTALPAVKELCAEHGATHATVAKALEGLLQAGRIRRFGRGYRVTQAMAGSSGAELVLVAASYDDGVHLRATPRSTELWRCLEQGCQRRGLRLTTIRADEALGRGQRSVPSLLRSRSVEGLMLLPLVVSRPQLAELIALLRRSGRPVAILDEVSGVNPSLLAEAPLVQLFTMATSPMSGHDVGAYLVAAGHRRAAYVVSDPADPVVASRLTGLRQAFSAAGMTDAVTVAATQPAISVGDIVDRMPAFSRFRDQVIDASASMVGAVTGKRREVTVFPFAWDVAARAVMARVFKPVFQKLLRDGASAWVCYNDEVALAGLDFLAERTVRVPGQVSVVGFDDTLEAFGRNLTSYNFNVPAVTAAMFEHILKPAARRPSAVEIPGMVMERSSSGRCARYGRG